MRNKLPKGGCIAAAVFAFILIISSLTAATYLSPQLFFKPLPAKKHFQKPVASEPPSRQKQIAAAGSAPAVSYAPKPYYYTGETIAPLGPANNGGAVPSTGYGQLTTFAGGDTAGSVNGTGPVAKFNNPYGLATDAAGNVYVADNGNNKIRKITSAGVVTTLAGNGTAGAINGTGTAASFNAPVGLAADAAGNVYVAESYKIRKITPAGVVTTVAGGTTAGSHDGTGASATFGYPAALVIDGSNNIYVADGNLIRKVTPAGVVTTFAGSGNYGNDNGQGTAASFEALQGITMDAAGNLYVTDGDLGAYDGSIRKITPGGLVSTIVNTGLSNPTGIAIDKAGNLYIATATDNLYKLSSDGLITPFVYGDIYADMDQGVAIDNFGNMYVSNSGAYNGGNYSNDIQRISLKGYAVFPALPRGLTINPGTGIITGVPQNTAAVSDYKIVAYNQYGSSVATVSFGVARAAVKPQIKYVSPQVYMQRVVIAPLSPTNTGGAIPKQNYGEVSTLAGAGYQGLQNSTGDKAAFNEPFGTAVDTLGNIYIADYGNNLIRKSTPDGVVTTFAGSGSKGAANGSRLSASFNGPVSVDVDVSGNIYVADAGNNEIRKINPAGNVSTFAGSTIAGKVDGAGSAARFSSPHGLAVDGHGNIYVADYSNNSIRKVTPAGVVSTLAGDGVAGSTNGIGAVARFNSPAALTVGVSGDIYVADKGNNLVRKITAAGVVSTLAGSGAKGSANAAGSGASFNAPQGIVAAAGNVYVADGSNNLIRKITPVGVVSTFAGQSSGGFQDGSAAIAEFSNPHGLSFDILGNLYVADYGNAKIRKISLAGYTISPNLPFGLNFDSSTGTISGSAFDLNPAADYTVTAYYGGGSVTTSLNITVNKAPTAPIISYAGPNVYHVNSSIAPLAPSNSGDATPGSGYGTITTFAGSGIAGSANGKGTAASFHNPYGIATDPQGNVYVADSANNKIRKITPGGTVTTLAGSGAAGAANGNAASASFNGPEGVAIDNVGNIYVADFNNNMIRRITPAGVVSTLAGSATRGFANGTATAARFSGPTALIADSLGNIYVTDYYNARIRKVTAAGEVTTFAGSGNYDNHDGTGTSADMNSPHGITIDEAGNLYVAESHPSNIVRKITPSAVVTTITPSIPASLAGIAIDNAGTLYLSGPFTQIFKLQADGTVVKFKQNFSSSNVGVAVDATGNLYFSNTLDNSIIKVNLRGYTMNPVLPEGLVFSANTGVISGRPTVKSPATNYNIVAYNSVGSSTAVVNIEVTDTAQPMTAQSEVTEPSVKSAMSPNGDGKNDALVIENIEKYPDNKLILLNVNGKKIFEISGYDNGVKKFDGHSNVDGSMQKAGTYYYVLNYQSENGPQHKTGYFLIKY